MRKIGVLLMLISLLCFGIGMFGIESKYIDCGIVIDKYNSSSTYKHRTTNENILIVKYTDTIEEINANTNTFYTKNIGDEVCFTRLNNEKQKLVFTLIAFGYILGFISLGILLFEL